MAGVQLVQRERAGTTGRAENMNLMIAAQTFSTACALLLQQPTGQWCRRPPSRTPTDQSPVASCAKLSPSPRLACHWESSLLRLPFWIPSNNFTLRSKCEASGLRTTRLHTFTSHQVTQERAGHKPSRGSCQQRCARGPGDPRSWTRCAATMQYRTLDGLDESSNQPTKQHKMWMCRCNVDSECKISRQAEQQCIMRMNIDGKINSMDGQ